MWGRVERKVDRKVRGVWKEEIHWRKRNSPNLVASKKSTCESVGSGKPRGKAARKKVGGGLNGPKVWSRQQHKREITPGQPGGKQKTLKYNSRLFERKFQNPQSHTVGSQKRTLCKVEKRDDSAREYLDRLKQTAKRS